MIYFDWDSVKAKSNLRKHGVRFEAATEVFSDPFAFSEVDRRVHDEQRWKTTGLAGRSVMVVVCLIETMDEDEYVRIISARKAERKEVMDYERKKLH